MAATQGSDSHSPLTRDRILEEAMHLADEGGIEALSMRKLARRLGVEAMSLYYHVANKDEILDGMAEAFIGEVELPPIGGDWKAETRTRARSVRSLLNQHPWASRLLETRSSLGPAGLRYYDTMIGCLREGGFSVAAAAHAVSLIDAYVYGFGLQELNLPFEGEHDIEEIAEAILSLIPSDTYPYLAEMITDHALQPGYLYGDEFEFGLDLILEALSPHASAS